MAFIISDDEECQHDSLYYMGRDAGENRYVGCRDCGAVIIKTAESSQEKKRMTEEEEGSIFDKLLNRFLNK